MFNPKVSIVIPVFNGSDYLAEAIESALAQTYGNREILVINDGSNDNGHTEQIAKSYGNAIRYFSKLNGGVASALNLAVANMSGNYFSWLSHDDLYVPEKIEKQIEVLYRSGLPDSTVIYSNYATFTDDPDRTIPVYLKGVPPKQFRYWITTENKLHGCTLLIPKKAFEKTGTFNEQLKTTQDYDLWFRMATECSFIHIPNILVKSRCHPNQGTHKMADIALSECNELLSNFVINLSHEEIVQATSSSIHASYEIIASSMFRRGFSRAGNVAEKYASQYCQIKHIKIAKYLRNARYINSRLFNICRKALPLKVKKFLKVIALRKRQQLVKNNESQQNQLKDKFSEIYQRNIFGGAVSRSGAGSDLIQTKRIRRALPELIQQYSVQTMMDAPCGDWFWMKETELGVKHYYGVDIVEALITHLCREYGSPERTFLCLDLVNDSLPQVDMIFSRDCLVHLCFTHALDIIANFKKSGARYLLTTSFTEQTCNNDLTGTSAFWRPLNLCLAPFNFPEPLLVIQEGCTEENGRYGDKSLCMWQLKDISV